MPRIDLTILRKSIGGDVELERELFEEFISSSGELIGELERTSIDTSKGEEWRQAAHALKGISLNLGASLLGDLSKQAQEGCEKDAEFKKSLLEKIHEEQQKVVDFLNSQKG